MPLPLLLIPLMLAVMWVALIRPQQKRAQAHQELVDSLQVGARVMTTAGVYGDLVGLDGDTARLEVAPGVVLTIARRSVGEVVQAPSTPAPPPPTDGAAVGGSATAEDA